MPAIKEPIFETGNYVERADGATYVRFDDTRVYFNANKIVAVVMPGMIYRSKEAEEGIVYRRVRAAMLKYGNNKKIVTVTNAELKTMLEVAIMQMASKLVDCKLKIEKRPALVQ